MKRTVAASVLADRLARRLAGAHLTCSVDVIPGSSAPPSLEGESYYYTATSAPGSVRVHHPSAYRRAGGRPVYQCSTLRVEVGEDWYAQAEHAARHLRGVR